MKKEDEKIKKIIKKIANKKKREAIPPFRLYSTMQRQCNSLDKKYKPFKRKSQAKNGQKNRTTYEKKIRKWENHFKDK